MGAGCGCCCGAGATMSRASNGFIDVVAAGAVGVLSMEIPLTPDLVGGVGVVPLDLTGFCSPNLIKASTALSRLPFNPFSTVLLRFSSGKPMSLNVANLESNPSPDVLTLDPNTLDGLFTRGGELSPLNPPIPGETGGVALRGKVEDFWRPNPNRFVGFGGSGGGLSSWELVLPVFCRVPGRESVRKARSWYFCLMYLSMALSTSSMSIGICGFTFRGL